MIQISKIGVRNENRGKTVTISPLTRKNFNTIVEIGHAMRLCRRGLGRKHCLDILRFTTCHTHGRILSNEQDIERMSLVSF